MNQPCTSRVSRELRGHVLMIGLDRVAKRNAFDLDLLNELSLAYGEFEADTEARVAVVFGMASTLPPDWTWSMPAPRCRRLAGSDRRLRSVGCFRRSEGQQTGDCRRAGLLPDHRHRVDAGRGYQPVREQYPLRANGSAARDFPFGGATLRLHQVAGWGNAMRWLLTGDEFDAHDALRLGLVQEVMASEDLLPRAIELAERIARQAPLGVQATLMSARQARYEGETVAAQGLPALVKKLLSSEDAKEGVCRWWSGARHLQGICEMCVGLHGCRRASSR
jgi:1,4-dihydroxy-2-naphthoyl-CoA synthase